VELSTFYSFVKESIDYLKAHPNLACVVIFSWAFLETALLLGLILPAEKVLIFSSLLAAKGLISPFHFVVCGSLGTFLGYTVSYFFGAFLGKEFLKELLLKLKLSKEEFEKTKRFIEEKGELSLIFGRFIPVVRPVLPVFIGSFRPSLLKFSLFNGLGALLWMLSYLFFGSLMNTLFSTIIKHKLLVIPFAVLLLLLFLFWRRHGKNQKDL